MNWRDCDDDACGWCDDAPCWTELEDLAGPEYFMYRDEMDKKAAKPPYRPKRQTYVFSEGWQNRLC